MFVRPLVPSWRPSGPTLLVDRRPGVGQGHVIVAVPVSGDAPVDLVALPSDAVTWDIRRDGSAIVVAVMFQDCAANGSCDFAARLAVIDLISGRARWIEPPH